MCAPQIIRDFTRHAGVTNSRSDVVRARFGPAGEFAEHDSSVREMLNDSRLDSIQAYEAKPAENLRGRKMFRELLLIAQSILQRDHGGTRTNEWRQ